MQKKDLPLLKEASLFLLLLFCSLYGSTDKVFE